MNVANIGNIVQELFQENVVRGRLETRSVLVKSVSVINCIHTHTHTRTHTHTHIHTHIHSHTHSHRGVLARSLVQAQAASPTFTHVYAALVSIINTKFPQTGELIAKRLMLQFQKGFRRNDKVNNRLQWYLTSRTL